MDLPDLINRHLLLDAGRLKSQYIVQESIVRGSSLALFSMYYLEQCATNTISKLVLSSPRAGINQVFAPFTLQTTI